MLVVFEIVVQVVVIVVGRCLECLTMEVSVVENEPARGKYRTLGRAKG